MPLAELKVRDKSYHPSDVQDVINRFKKLPRWKEYLNTCMGGVIFVTDNPANLSKGNQDQLRDIGGVVAGKDDIVRTPRAPPGFVPITQYGHNQNKPELGLPLMIWLDVHTPDSYYKDPLKILIHEIGHFKWSGFGKKAGAHSPEFHRMLYDAIKALGLEPDENDSRNAVIKDVANPIPGGYPLGNICGTF